MAEKKKVKRIGETRQSQALRTFGVGAVVDFQYHSAMPLGLDHWPERSQCQTIHERDLERILRVKWFQAPPVADADHAYPERLKASRFPRWLFCPKCNALGMVRDYDPEGGGPLFGSIFSFDGIGGGEARCTRTLGKRNCGGIGVPTRLVRVCCPPAGPEVEHLGHIDDFPWYGWAHQGEGKPGSEEKENHYLKLLSSSRTLAIEDLTVVCSCGASKSLRGVFSRDAMQRFSCKGWAPWLEPRRDARGCEFPVKVFLRGATNLHLPVTQSVISIPPFSDALNEVLSDRFLHLERDFDRDCRQRSKAGIPWQSKREFCAGQLEYLREDGFDRSGEYSDEDILECLVLRLGGADDEDENEGTLASRIDSRGRRSSECEALRAGDDNPHGNFDAIPVDVPDDWTEYIGGLVKVRKLRKVEALRGFRRDSQGNPDTEALVEKFAPLSSKPFDWLPAIEMKGEGIFIELNPGKVRTWEKEKAVEKRMSFLKDRFEQEASERGWEDAQCPSARYVLVHTFAHLMIRQLTLECGYSSASLQERLYVATPDEVAAQEGPTVEMAGCLIYTATPDAEGSYGGLVRMGEPDRFTKLMGEGIRIATWCSSDPICSTVEGQGYKAFNRAACHACALVSETSCERRNTFLDRALVVAPRGFDEMASFFRTESVLGTQIREDDDGD